LYGVEDATNNPFPYVTEYQEKSIGVLEAPAHVIPSKECKIWFPEEPSATNKFDGRIAMLRENTPCEYVRRKPLFVTKYTFVPTRTPSVIKQGPSTGLLKVTGSQLAVKFPTRLKI
jgi:hypothetical protein